MKRLLEQIKEIDPHELATQVISNPKVQATVGGVTVTTGGAVANSNSDLYVVIPAIIACVLGSTLTIMCIVHRWLLIRKELKE